MCVTHDVTREVIHKIFIHSLVEMLLLRFETLHGYFTALQSEVSSLQWYLSYPFRLNLPNPPELFVRPPLLNVLADMLPLLPAASFLGKRSSFLRNLEAFRSALH